MMKVVEVLEWLQDLDLNAEVGIDEGGLQLVQAGTENYLELGGIPEPEVDTDAIPVLQPEPTPEFHGRFISDAIKEEDGNARKALSSIEQECLIQAAKDEVERAGEWKIQFELDLSSSLAMCGNLQLALRHPLNAGPSAAIARRLIDDLHNGMKERGFVAHAQMVALGDDPSYDYDPRATLHKPRLVVVTPERSQQ